jgi:hypothetical protein
MTLLPPDWNPTAAGDRVLAGLTNVCLPAVKGAHDSDLLLLDGKAYIIYMANDVQPGEAPDWPFVYTALSVVDLATGHVDAVHTVAASAMAFANVTLPAGACFVPRLVQLDARTLRCFFASEDPGARQSQTWYRDYDLRADRLAEAIFPVELATDEGVFPMQPQHLHRHAVGKGFTGAPTQHGLYMIDGIKPIDGVRYAVLNNFPGGQLALATLNDAADRFTVIGDFFLPHEAKLTESAVERLPDGTWLAVSRQENRDHRYMFATSPDGRQWSAHAYRDCVPNGSSSKSTLDRIGDVYYLGWNEATQVDGVYRSVFNLDISRDGLTWERKYRFATVHTFQYPVFRAVGDAVYLTVTQGDHSDSRKERIMFGRLE